MDEISFATAMNADPTDVRLYKLELESTATVAAR